MNWRLFFTLLLVTATLGQAQPSAFNGVFANEQITLNLQESNGTLSGQLQFQGQVLPISARATGPNALAGTYLYLGQNYPFSATLQGTTLTLTSEGQVYILQKHSANESLPTSGSLAPQAVQNPNEIVDKEFGARFTPPAGWIAQKNETGYLLGSNTEKGLIIISANEYSSLQQMRSEAQQGLVDEDGTNLQLAGKMEPVGANGLGAPYQGTVQGQSAKAYAVGLLSPLGGGATIMAMVEAASYSEKYANYAKSIASSMQFFKPEMPPIAEQWQRDLSGTKLTYLWSYYSGGSSDGSYVGGSQKTEIHLCPQGFFKYFDSNHMAIDGGSSTGANASAYGSGKDQGHGRWEVIGRGQTPFLVLTFHDGRKMQYRISFENNKLYLDGNRYFRTTANSEAPEQRPQCW